MSYNYTGVPSASITPIMTNMGIGPAGPMMAGGPQTFMNTMLGNQPPGGNMILPAGPGMNDSPLEFNINKNIPQLPLESNGRPSIDDDYVNPKNEARRDRNRRIDRRESRDARRDERRTSRDRDRIREKDSRRGGSEDSTTGSIPAAATMQADTNPPVNPGMWSGMMGMGYPMMGMIMDPTNMMTMNNYGTMMQPIIQPDGSIIPADPTIDPMIPPAGPLVKEVIHCKSCTLYPPSPTAPVPTTRERPPGCRTVFVGGLPENMTAEILNEVFEKCGEITTLRLSKKTFCHIRFMYENSVDAAIYLSGYRVRIGNNSDPPNSGRLHVDYAHARDDQYEWECKQRALIREQRHRERMEEERLRPPSPPPVQHYTEHEAATVADKIKQDESFTKAVQVVITWLERGDCNKRNSNTFYSMIQSTNSHVRRLLSEKTQYEEELQKAREIMKGRMQGILLQFGQIERVFAAACHKKVWDHFTKAQRKNIDMWKKQTQEIKSVQLDDIFTERADEEMEVSDTDDIMEAALLRKRPRTIDLSADEKVQLKDENDSLRCQLEAYKNEVDLVRSELQSTLDLKEKQLQMLQQTLKGMQKQLLDSVKRQNEDDARVKDLQALLESRGQDKECTIIDLDGTDSPGSKSDEIQASVTPPAAAPISDRDAKLIGLISTFLHVHPFGAGVDYIWSYLQKLEPSLKPSDVENIMSKFPTVFRQELSGIGANMERRWQFNGFQTVHVSSA